MTGLKLEFSLKESEYVKGAYMPCESKIINAGSAPVKVDRGEWSSRIHYRMKADDATGRQWVFSPASYLTETGNDERMPEPGPNWVELPPGGQLEINDVLSSYLPDELESGRYSLVAEFPHDDDWLVSSASSVHIVVPVPTSYSSLFDPISGNWASGMVQKPIASGSKPVLSLRESSGHKGFNGTDFKAEINVLITGSAMEPAPPEQLAKYSPEEAVPAMGETHEHEGRWFLWRSGRNLGAVLWENGAREVMSPEAAPYDELRLLSPGYAPDAEGAWFVVTGRKDGHWYLLGLKARKKGIDWVGQQVLGDKPLGPHALSFSPRKDKGSFSFLWVDGTKVYRQFLNVHKKNPVLDPTLVHEAQGEVLALWMPPLAPGRNERPEALILSATETPGEYQLARLNLAKPDKVALRLVPAPPGEAERVVMCTLPEGGFALLAQTGDQLHYHFGGATEAWKLLHRSPGAKFHNIHLALTTFNELWAEWLDDRYGRQWAQLPRK